MKTYQSSAICPKCGELLRTNNAKSYNFYCHNCNGRFRSNSIKMSRMIQTNMGEMPLQDYLDIRALECGFDSYKELEEAGFSIEIPETSKEKEQTLVPRPD